MGSVVWSADTLIVSYLQPAIFSYNNKNYPNACVLLDGLNSFFKGFGVGIDDLPKPKMVTKALNQEFSYDRECKSWFDMYFPLISLSMGKYLRETIDAIKMERGTA